MAYINSYKNQNWLIPPSIKDMISRDHICFFVEEFVESQDFSNFDQQYDGAGHPAYHPRILLKIILQGMLSRIRSSRKLAAATHESFIFMYLSEKVNPDFRTLARFRKENANFIKNCFKQTIKLASDYNFLDLSFIGIDGSKIKAQANKKFYLDKITLDKLDHAIDKMLEEDIALDDLEEQIFENKEEGLTGMNERDLRKIVRENFKNKDKQKLKQKILKAKNELIQNNLKKVSLTDPDCRMMQQAKKYFELTYNTQFSVTRNQIIVANDLSQEVNDFHQLIPQIENIKQNVSLTRDTKVAVDCGYSDGRNIQFAEEKNIDLYVPSKEQAQRMDKKKIGIPQDNYEYDPQTGEIIVNGERYIFRGEERIKKRGVKALVYVNLKLKKRKYVPYYFKERLRMRDKMEKTEARKIYSLRKCTVEPVIGNIKQNLGFREFLLKGLNGTKIELNLISIAHNLRKIWNLKRITSNY